MSTNGSSSKSAHGGNSETFEESFRQLQEVVRRLSEGSLTLQDALSSFEEGMRLADRCSTMLDEAELRVKQVSERAMLEGAAAVSALDSSFSPSAGDVTLVEVEVERYEAAMLLEGAPDQSGGQKRATARPAAQSSSTLLDELDPLFDEDN